jgi:hypothetical protein
MNRPHHAPASISPPGAPSHPMGKGSSEGGAHPPPMLPGVRFA